MWYDKSKNQWIIGDPTNVGTTTGAIYGAAGNFRYPWEVENVWSRWNNSWEKCSDLKVVKGERIILCGCTIPKVKLRLGVYVSHRMNDNRLAYMHEKGSSWIWYLASKKQWIVGNVANIGSGTGMMYASSDASSPVNISTGWNYFHVGWKPAVGLQCKSLPELTNDESRQRDWRWGPSWLADDIIGCGLDIARREIFFTRNGEHLGVAFQDVDISIPLYPTVGFSSPNEKV